MKALAIAIALSLTLSHTAASAADAEAETPRAADAKAEPLQASKPARTPQFKPTNVGAPMTRLGGATRGALGGVPRTEALVPEEVGHTLQAQPVLYWYLDATTDDRIDFALIGVDPINPILETTLKGPFSPGIQRIRMADLGISLEPGVEYQWFVRVIPNPDQRLYDRVVGGGIQRIEASEELRAKIAAAPKQESYFVLAEAGIWYDALDSLSLQVDAAPGDANLRAQRASLFEQVGLENVN
jgi:hypothetical protein